MSSSMEVSLLAAGILETRSTLFRTLHGSRIGTVWETIGFLLMGWGVAGESKDVLGGGEGGGWEGFGIHHLPTWTRGPPRARTTFADRAMNPYHPNLVTGINRRHPEQGACEVEEYVRSGVAGLSLTWEDWLFELWGAATPAPPVLWIPLAPSLSRQCLLRRWTSSWHHRRTQQDSTGLNWMNWPPYYLVLC